MIKNKYISALFSLLAGTFTIPASSEVITGTTLSVNFESANIVGSGRHINMHRVPVTNIDTGKTAFYDASFKFTFSQSTGFQFEQISSVGISPPLSSSNLIPGKYTGDVRAYEYVLSEPSTLSDGRLFYTLSGINTSDAFSAQIVTGEVTNHPDIGSREIIPSLSATYIYGIVTSNIGFGAFAPGTTRDKWLVNHLIGVRQTGSTLSITLFSQGVNSEGLSQDFASQRDGAVLTRVIE